MPLPVPRRATLPAGQENYVTAAGLQALRVERVALLTQRSSVAHDAATLTRIHAQLTEIESRIATAVTVVPADSSRVRFGMFVLVQNDEGVQTHYQIVGVDEADANTGRLSFLSPLARALLGNAAGDTVSVRTPHGEKYVKIVLVTLHGNAATSTVV